MTDMNELYKKMNTKIGDLEINTDTIIQVVQIAMECVELTQLTGAEKKDLAIVLIKQVVEESDLIGNNEKLLLDMIDKKILHSMIDLVVNSKDIEINLQKIKCWCF